MAVRKIGSRGGAEQKDTEGFAPCECDMLFPVIAEVIRESTILLRPYWIKTDEPMALGYGITALSERDAEAILRRAVSSDCAIITVKPLENATQLDRWHVVPNMGNMLRRGIWYPLGYDHILG